jgi:hypothetical protein
MIPDTHIPITGREFPNYPKQVSMNPSTDIFGLIGMYRHQYYIINFSLNIRMLIMELVIKKSIAPTCFNNPIELFLNKCHCTTIGARVGSADQDASERVAKDDLPSTKLRPIPTSHCADRMSAIRQIRDRLWRNAIFQGNLPTGGRLYAKARHIQGSLRVKALCQSKENLEMSLRLHKAAHHPHWTEQGSVLLARDHGRDDGMVGAFPRCERIRMPRIQTEIVAAILKSKAPTMGNNSRPKSHVITIDERAGVPPLIDDAKIHRVRTGQGSAALLIEGGFLGIDEFMA